MKRLEGKVAVITGATSGMGRDTAYLFAEEGAKVVVVGRHEERAKEVVEKIRAKGGEAAAVIADLINLSNVNKIFDETMKAFGTIDILFNNAGKLSLSRTEDISVEEWDDTFKIDVSSYLFLAQKFAPVMKAKGKGAIINNGSVAGTSARWGTVAYCTMKHAVNGLTAAMARELGPEIRVNAILPGAIHTAMLDSVGGPDAAKPMALLSPLQRIGTGREIATTVLFLATDDSSFITGQMLRVDGGIDC